MAELQTKKETVSVPVPAPAEPPLAEAPPVDVVDKKALAPPPSAAEETKALAVVENESEFLFLPFMFQFLIFWLSKSN